jgi:hypothetical protein
MVCDMHLNSRSRHPGQGEAAIRDPGFSMACRLPDNGYSVSVIAIKNVNRTAVTRHTKKAANSGLFYPCPETSLHMAELAFLLQGTGRVSLGNRIFMAADAAGMKRGFRCRGFRIPRLVLVTRMTGFYRLTRFPLESVVAGGALGKTQVGMFLVVESNHPELGIELDDRLVGCDLRLLCHHHAGSSGKHSQYHQDYAHCSLLQVVASYRYFYHFMQAL